MTAKPNAGLIDAAAATDLFLNLEARGATPQALAASLDREFALEAQRATIRPVRVAARCVPCARWFGSLSARSCDLAIAG
jgi:hypothetical protein